MKSNDPKEKDIDKNSQENQDQEHATPCVSTNSRPRLIINRSKSPYYQPKVSSLAQTLDKYAEHLEQEIRALLIR